MIATTGRRMPPLPTDPFPGTLSEALTGTEDPPPLRVAPFSPITWAAVIMTGKATVTRESGPMIRPGYRIPWIHIWGSHSNSMPNSLSFRLLISPPSKGSTAAPEIIQNIFPTHCRNPLGGDGAPIPGFEAPASLPLNYRHAGPLGQLTLAISNPGGTDYLTAFWILIEPTP